MSRNRNRAQRVVHYTATGSAGLAFPCYFKELRSHLDSGIPDPEIPQFMERYTLPCPRRHTDLRRVTCPECWAGIAGMVRDRDTRTEGEEVPRE